MPNHKRKHFVVQMHQASHLHYDFRLEVDGVLASWAIPKGPTLAVGKPRLAVHVDNHPLSYRDFEGVIPPGHYGAGRVILWDSGTYQTPPGEEPASALSRGKITFDLRGKKLRGRFTLLKMHRRANESNEPWLLIKDRDKNVDPTFEPENYPNSVKSGKRIDDL